MGRPIRQQTPHCVYHVINRGNKRAAVFRDENDFLSMKMLILEAKKIFPIRLYHYVFMPNHFHLMIEPEEEEALSGFMQYISVKYAKRCNTKHGTTGHIWQGRYRSLLIEKDAYFMQCGKYIELNPVRGNLARNPQDYPWSSYRFHAFGEVDVIADVHDLYSSLGKTLDEVQRSYRRLLIEDVFGPN